MFNSSIQVVEIKLQVELEQKRKKALHLQKVSRKGMVLGKAFPLADRILPRSCARRHLATQWLPRGLPAPALRELVAPGDHFALGAAALAACSHFEICWLSLNPRLTSFGALTLS